MLKNLKTTSMDGEQQAQSVTHGDIPFYSDRFAKAGIYLLGIATIAAGILDLIWGEFEAAHQPVGALSDHVPRIFAYFAAVWMILAGTAILLRRTARIGALATAMIYFVFAMFWLPRFYTVPQMFGFSLAMFINVVAGMFTQLTVVAGCLILYASFTRSASYWSQKLPVIIRWTFGLGSVFFGLAHFVSVDKAAPMIPEWMPFAPSFWVVLTGIGFLLAGLAILSGIQNVLAARLLTLMLLIFEIALLPPVVANPNMHIAWGSNAYNLAAAGAIWIFAASIAAYSTPTNSVSVGSRT